MHQFFFTKFSFKKLLPDSDSLAVPVSLFVMKTWIFSSFTVSWNTWTSFKDLSPISSFLMHLMQGHGPSLEWHFKFEWFVSFLCHLKGIFKHLHYKLWLPSRVANPGEARGLTCLFKSFSFQYQVTLLRSLCSEHWILGSPFGDLTQNEGCNLRISVCEWNWMCNNSESAWTWSVSCGQRSHTPWLNEGDSLVLNNEQIKQQSIAWQKFGLKSMNPYKQIQPSHRNKWTFSDTDLLPMVKILVFSWGRRN